MVKVGGVESQQTLIRYVVFQLVKTWVSTLTYPETGLVGEKPVFKRLKDKKFLI